MMVLQTSGRGCITGRRLGRRFLVRHSTIILLRTWIARRCPTRLLRCRVIFRHKHRGPLHRQTCSIMETCISRRLCRRTTVLQLQARQVTPPVGMRRMSHSQAEGNWCFIRELLSLLPVLWLMHMDFTNGSRIRTFLLSLLPLLRTPSGRVTNILTCDLPQ